MKSKLDNKYLVLNWRDINNTLNNSELRRLTMMLQKISTARHKEGRNPEKKYVVTSDTSKSYGLVEDLMLAEINEIQDGLIANIEVQKLIYKAVETALIAEREKMKELLPSERKVIIPDPEQPDEVEEKPEVTKAMETAKKVLTEGKTKSPVKKQVVKKKAPIKKPGAYNAKNKS